MQRSVPAPLADGVVRARRPRSDGVRRAGGGERRRRPPRSRRGRGDRFPHAERGRRRDDGARNRCPERSGAAHAAARGGRAASARVRGRAHRAALRALVRGRPFMMDVLRLVRIQNLAVAAGGVPAGGWMALGAITTPTVLALAALAAVGFGAAGNALNDIWDRPADRVNRPDQRPLAAGRLARGAADLCVAGGIFVGFAAAALVNGTAVLVGAAACAVMVVYSPLLKRQGLPGNVAVALVAGLPRRYGAIAVGRAKAGLVPWILAAWIHLVREIVKDLDDESGDRALGRRTLPIVSAP